MHYLGSTRPTFHHRPSVLTVALLCFVLTVIGLLLMQLGR